MSEAARFGFRLHHVGVATNDIPATTGTLESIFGYRTISGPFDDPIQRVTVSFLTMSEDDTVEVELVAPLTEDSPVRSVLKKGGSAYHLCLETTDLDGALEHAKTNGSLVVSQPAPAVAFGGRRIAWIFTRSHQLVELLETTAV